MNEDELKDSVVLVFANKQDLPNAMAVDVLTEKLELHNLKGRKVRDGLFISSLRKTM